MTWNNRVRAAKVEVDGIKFDSRLEAARYSDLKLMQQAGEITELQVHPKWQLQPTTRLNGVTHRAIAYEADFSYRNEAGQLVVEDVKPRTRKNRNDPAWAIFRLKVRMMAYVHKINVAVVEL